MTVLSVAIPLLSYAVVVPAVMTPLCRREKVKRGIGEVGERTGGGRGEIILVKLIQNKFFFGGGDRWPCLLDSSHSGGERCLIGPKHSELH